MIPPAGKPNISQSRGEESRPQRPLRILLAPVNTAGQLQMIGDGLRNHGQLATVVSYDSLDSHERVTDLVLGLNNRSKLWKAYGMSRFFMNAIQSYDIFHFFYGKSLLPRHIDLPILKRLGKKIIVHFQGSDIRQQKYLHRVVLPQLMGLPPTDDTRESNPQQLMMIKKWRKYADAILLANPDMLRIVPEGILLQQAIDLSQWEFSPETAGTTVEEIVIAHAPSSRQVKGTEYVITAVEELKTRGYPVRLLLIENVPHNLIKDTYKTCHIGVDELFQGIPANVSIELMAMGKPVIAHLDPWYAEHRPDLPVVNATPANLVKQLKLLICDQQLRISLGKQGRAYVEKYHDVNLITSQLLVIYQGLGSLSRTGPASP